MDLLGVAAKTSKSYFEVNQVSIDNWTFKFFYKATVLLVVLCSVVVTSRQFFGEPISCDAGQVSHKKITVGFVCTTYCQC